MSSAVTLTANARLDGRRVVLDYVLANPGPAPVAVVDADDGVDVLVPLGPGAFRSSYLRAEADPAAGPAPDVAGRIVAAGGELAGRAAITGEFDELPGEVELCIEVVPPPWTDAGGGVARFPRRPVGREPVLACTPRLAVRAP